jgi:hypothetical protein
MPLHTVPVALQSAQRAPFAPQVALKTLLGGCTQRSSPVQQPAQVAGEHELLAPPAVAPPLFPPATPPPAPLAMHAPALQVWPVEHAAHCWPPWPQAVTPSPRAHVPSAVQHPSTQFEGPHVGPGGVHADSPTRSPIAQPATTRMNPPAAALYANWAGRTRTSGRAVAS